MIPADFPAEPTAPGALEMPFSKIEVVLPREGRVAQMLAAQPRMPFAAEVMDFIDQVGRRLLTDPSARRFPELVALGFWARAANLNRLKARFDAAYPGSVRMPRGVAVHVAPSNVDTIFVYSLLLSMLAGNLNIVRISSRAGKQSNLLLVLLEQAIGAAPPELREMVAVVRYQHDKAITDALSLRADLRIVWGGDATVDLLRESPLSPAGTELVFPNRYSLSVMSADHWLSTENRDPIVRAFVNDALWFGQMACSSPRALVWVGTPDEIASASASFWPAVEANAAQAGFEWEDAQAVAKLLAEQDAALSFGAEVVPLSSNFVRVIRCPLTELGKQTDAGGGFFREYSIGNLAELAPAIRRSWQTVTSAGISAEVWRMFLAEHRPRGLDRITPFGKALDFDAIWDGIDLLAAMTRITKIDL